jgi:hypothetical protein
LGEVILRALQRASSEANNEGASTFIVARLFSNTLSKYF